jgi:outer membrane protein
MNKVLLILTLILAHFSVQGQKFGHYSSEYVVSQMPSYYEAQKDLEQLSNSWLEEIKSMYLQIGRLENKLQAEKVLLTSEMIAEREQEIAEKMKEVTNYHSQVFGYDGLFFLKKMELIKPELEKVFEAAQRVCKKQRLDYLFDISDNLVIIYANPVHDYTDYVLEELGLGDPNDVVE